MKLFEPIRIGAMELRNRIVMSPMTTGYASPEGLPTPALVAFLEVRARGGVGLVTLEASVVDRRHREVPRSLHFADDAAVSAHRALVEAVHAHGAKIQPQLVHAGPDALSPQLERVPSLGPSVIPSYLTGTPCRELDAAELPALLDLYAAAAVRVRDAGYDGIELHAAHGYMLIGSFLTPWRNRRRDAYAGHSRDGRLRFLLEVIAAIRREVGDRLPITLRLSGYERVAGGRGLEDTARIAPRLAEAGVAAFHVSGGVIDRLTSMIVAGSEWGPAHNLAAARAVRHAVDVPVMTVGRIHDPGLAARIVERGQADLVVMGRPLLADPELPRKLREGRRHEIRACISCHACIDSMERGPMRCAVNGRSGVEAELRLDPAASPRRVLVIGGGPGGLETARIAALRGHRVSLVERQHFLGGALVAAATVHPANAPFLRFLRREVRRLGVEVELGRELDAEAVRRRAPDAVVVATGARIATPPLAGAEQRHVLTGPRLRALLGRAARYLGPGALRALSRLWLPVGRRVAIVGADLAALELAEFLAERGREVTLVEPGEELAPEVGPKRRAEHMDRLDRLGVAVNTGMRVEEITPRGLAVRPQPGSTRVIEVEHVVLAGTPEPDAALFEALREVAPEVHAVGDCCGVGLIQKAVADATRVACTL